YLQLNKEQVWICVKNKSSLPKWFREFPYQNWFYCGNHKLEASLSRSLGASVGTAFFGTLIYSLLPGLSPNSGLQAIAALPQSEILHAFQIGFAVAALLALLLANSG
ncbi:type IV toxin-antitoxin system AbiEi family antitoxin domain-containing protein, partial [Vibrio cholerae]|uniref:type IV toxin-antitoxin system AbiEi family antitoxin domain-containing protein n=1 Tax=Vibrio cholerae TaxID=666 RepID=UPI00311E5286